MKYNDIISKKIFLGGTCGESDWRKEVIDQLESSEIDYFNPVVDNWDDAAQQEEDKQKEKCGIHLYGLTKEQSGAYTFFEIPYSVHKGKKVIILIIDILENEQFKTTVDKIIKDAPALDIEVCFKPEELLKVLT